MARTTHQERRERAGRRTPRRESAALTAEIQDDLCDVERDLLRDRLAELMDEATQGFALFTMEP